MFMVYRVLLFYLFRICCSIFYHSGWSIPFSGFVVLCLVCSHSGVSYFTTTHYVPYLRDSIAYDHGYWYACVKEWFFQVFFHFLEIFMIQNDKKFSPSHSISQEPYIMWLSFMVRMCKMTISLVIFFIFFKILIFWVHRGMKRQTTVRNEKKFCSAPYFRICASEDSHFCRTLYFRNHDLMIYIYGKHVSGVVK